MQKWADFWFGDTLVFVSDDGAVESIHGTVLKQKCTPPPPRGRPRVHLRDGKKRQWFFVSRMVLEAHGFPMPFSGAQARHLDGNFYNNKLQNLRWGTAKQNSDDKLRHGTHPSQLKKKTTNV